MESNLSPLESAEIFANYFSAISQEFEPIDEQNFPPDLALTEDIKIAVHCSLNPSIWFTGVKNPPAVTSSVCPQRATSKIPIKQCYNSILVDEKT